MKWLRRALLLISGLLLGPLAVAASGGANVAGDWRRASRESAHLAPSPESTSEAVVQVHHSAPDRYWFGARPEVLAELRGDEAAAAIAAIEKAVAAYPYPDRYRTWPGPNSNTFTAFVLRRVPSLAANLPPTAIGKDYLAHGALVDRPPSGSGLQLSLYGLLGVILSKEEGLEINLLGLAFGVDPRRLALRLPGVGLVGP